MTVEELKKESQHVEVPRKSCPICNRPTYKAVSLTETDKVEDAKLWFYCSCGVIFQENPPVKILKDQSFIDNHKNIKEYADVSIHAAKLYAPIIEELTYGRKILDVGFGTHNVMEYLRGRGWLTFGIDSNIDILETDRIIKDDFETTDKLYQKSYDAIWMSHVFEKFHSPIKVLKMCYDILQEDGVLYIATGDNEFLYSDPQRWPHWNSKENYVIWSTRALVEQLEKLGFEIIYKKRNFHKRFGYYHDLQIIAQKRFY